MEGESIAHSQCWCDNCGIYHLPDVNCEMKKWFYAEAACSCGDVKSVGGIAGKGIRLAVDEWAKRHFVEFPDHTHAIAFTAGEDTDLAQWKWD